MKPTEAAHRYSRILISSSVSSYPAPNLVLGERLGVLILLILFLSIPVFSMDYGAVVGLELNIKDLGETDFDGKFTIGPWLSLPLKEADLYISAGIHAGYDDSFAIVPELFRLEYSARFFDSLVLRAGRIPWQDTTQFIVKGVFDGFDFTVDMGVFRIGTSALYTGFLYKDSSYINSSPEDPKDYNLDFSWSDFSGTYFAPPRFLASLYGDFPGFPYMRGQLYAGILAQFDFSDAEEDYNTIYFLLKHTLVYEAFDLSVSGAIELEPTRTRGLRPAMAITIDGGYQLPGMLKDRLSLGLRYASGEGPYMAAFFPLIREAQGTVLRPLFSGIMLINLNYQILLLPNLSLEFGSQYFFRTDASTYNDPAIAHDSYALGLELDASVMWVPFSDLSLVFGGGVFLPQTGSAMAKDTPLRWSLSLKTLFSF